MKKENVAPLPAPENIQETQKHRLLREVTAGTVFNLGASAILPSIASGGLDVYGLIAFAFEGRSVRKKVRKTLNEIAHPELRFPRLRMALADAMLPENKMREKVDEWIQKEEEHLQSEINLSKSREKSTQIREIVYPIILGLGRTGIQIVTEVPHHGDGLTGFVDSVNQFIHNPGIIDTALQSFQHDIISLSTLMTLAVVGATAYGLHTSKIAQKDLTELLVQKKSVVRPTAETFMKHYKDIPQNMNVFERGLNGLNNVVTKLKSRRKKN